MSSAQNQSAAMGPAGQSAQSSEPSTSLSLFGRDYFSSPSQSAPGAGSADEGYTLGAGDRLAIHLGGKVQENFETTVTADGKIYLPTAGVLSVQGMTLTQARTALDLRLRRLYSNYTLDLVLLAPKMVRVAVTGDVKQPGNYTLSALNSVLDAVSLAQGPTDRGSLRDIQVYRGEALVARIDLYTHLLKPGQSADVLLQSGDKIFVPPGRLRVEITGEVFRPALYELAPGEQENLVDLITLAGGFTDLAFRGKIELSHMQPDGSRRISYINLAGGDSATAPLLVNEDRVRVYSVREQVPRLTVTIQGEVNRPGTYEWESGMHLSDLILKAGSLTRSAWLLKAEVAAVDPNLPPRLRSVNLERLLKSHEDSLDLVLGADDQVFIRRIPDWQVGPMVEIRGEVTFPGYYPIVDDSTLLSEVMKMAGSFTRDALISDAKLTRRLQPMPEDKEYERLLAMPRDQMSDREYEYLVMKQNSSDAQQIVVDFRKLLVMGDRSQDVALRDGDMIFVPKTPRVVQVSGRVARPGGVLYKPGAGYKYYIAQAGGLSWDADGRRTKVIKAAGDILDDEEVKEFGPGDRIWVPRKPDRNYWQIFRDTILVVGQLATIYLVIQNSTK
jgi:protein involved in polysaccharide export with SLBB domain